MKKIFITLLIFSLLSTFIFCKKEEENEINNLTKEDSERAQKMLLKILPLIQNIFNDYKNPKTEGEKFINEVLEKISPLLDLLTPLLNKDPQTFFEVLIQIGKKLENFDYEALIENTYFDVLLDGYFTLLTNENVLQICDLLKDDILYFIKKYVPKENVIYFEMIEEIYPNIINLMRSNDIKDFLQNCYLIFAYNKLGAKRFSKEYDVNKLGDEAKQIYFDKIKNNEDFKKIVSKISETIPFINQSMIDTYIDSYIDNLVNNTFDEDDDDY